jgi:hypothetical protein
MTDGIGAMAIDHTEGILLFVIGQEAARLTENRRSILLFCLSCQQAGFVV